MNDFLKYAFCILSVLFLNACSQDVQNDTNQVEDSTVKVEKNAAINPPQLPSVSDNPATELKK